MIANRWATYGLTVGWIALLAAAFDVPRPALAAGTKKEPPAGVAVKVTPEMLGAGAVSSGVTLPPIPKVTGSRSHPVSSWGKPLPYPIVVADRRNNRLIEIAPDKRIIWEFPSPALSIYRGNDDVFFSPDGNSLMVNEEDNYDIHIVDYEKRALIWSYGVPDTKGSKPGYFNYPDDAHLLADGTVVTADIRNCRIQFIDPATNRVLDEWGRAGQCKHNPPHNLNLPNGSTPLENGDVMVTEIPGAWISRITRAGKVVWSVQAPHVRYPSDAFPTRDGRVIVADFSKPGRVVIFDPATRKVTWEYFAKDGEKMLNHPSLALELPNGDVILNDDQRHRVLVIDRRTKQIIWQYGETDKPGHAPGFLFYPDGLDIDVFRDWKGALAGHP
jgi:DNA-binding beta-propeller fold protein YncE